MQAEEINKLIKDSKVDTNLISDGYHTFGELYEHRIALFMAMCLVDVEESDYEGFPVDAWRSKKHSDGTEWEGWFILGLNKEKGKQLTYHLPEKYWDKCWFVPILECAPEYDGHTSEDVLRRIMNLFEK